jgi:hypothetical protein
MKRLAPLLAVALAACGGGGSSSTSTPSPVVNNQSVGGIWNSNYTASNGDQIQAVAIATEDGRYFSASKDLSNNCEELSTGTLSVSGSTVSGNVVSAVATYATSSGVNTTCTFSDGSTWATGTVSGTVVQRSTATITSTGTTGSGTALPASTVTWSFNVLYNEPSSLAKIAGNWMGATGNTLTINADGSFFVQDPVSGCVINGAASILNASYNAYAWSATYANCQGTSAVLNGQTPTGIVTIDDTVTPNQLVGGVSVTLATGQILIVVAGDTRE